MSGLDRSTYEDIADVTVTDAGDLRLVDPGDVFVERGAVEGEITVYDAGDLAVRGQRRPNPTLHATAWSTTASTRPTTCSSPPTPSRGS